MPLFGVDLAFPGYLVVLAISYAAIGTLIAHFIGWPLVPLQFRQQRFESDFRFAIARVTDYADSVALMRGEGGGARRAAPAFQRAGAQLDCAGQPAESIERLHLRLLPRLDGLSRAGRHARLSPRRHSARRADAGVARLQKVEGAFAFCVTSYAKIAEWRAVMNRVAQFEAAMGEVDEPGLAGAALDIASSAARDLSIKDLVVRLPDGEPIASVPALDLAPADRLLVSGPSGAGKSSLFRALAGIWPLGEGRIRLPQRARVLALPQRPYFPLGTLRQAVSYPMLAEEVDDARVHEAMAAAGLGHLVERLDEEAEWSTVLSGGEQQRVGFARALIHRPTILLLDEPVTTLEEVGGARPLRPACRQAARHHRHLERALGGARRPAPSHPADERLAGGGPCAAAGARGGSGMTGNRTNSG